MPYNPTVFRPPNADDYIAEPNQPAKPASEESASPTQASPNAEASTAPHKVNVEEDLDQGEAGDNVGIL